MRSTLGGKSDTDLELSDHLLPASLSLPHRSPARSVTLDALSASVHDIHQTMHCVLDRFLLAEFRARELQRSVRDGFMSLFQEIQGHDDMCRARSAHSRSRGSRWGYRCREENGVRQDRTRGGHNTYRPTPELDSRREFGFRRRDSSKILRLLASSERTSHTLGTPSHQDNRAPSRSQCHTVSGHLAHIPRLCIESLSLSVFGLRKRVREALLADRFNNNLRYKMVYDN